MAPHTFYFALPGFSPQLPLPSAFLARFFCRCLWPTCHVRDKIKSLCMLHFESERVLRNSYSLQLHWAQLAGGGGWDAPSSNAHLLSEAQRLHHWWEKSIDAIAEDIIIYLKISIFHPSNGMLFFYFPRIEHTTDIAGQNNDMATIGDLSMISPPTSSISNDQDPFGQLPPLPPPLRSTQVLQPLSVFPGARHLFWNFSRYFTIFWITFCIFGCCTYVRQCVCLCLFVLPVVCLQFFAFCLGIICLISIFFFFCCQSFCVAFSAHYKSYCCTFCMKFLIWFSLLFCCAISNWLQL